MIYRLLMAGMILVGTSASAMAACDFNDVACNPFTLDKPPTLRMQKPLTVEPVLTVKPRKNTPAIVEKSDLQWCREYISKTPRNKITKEALDYCLYLFQRERQGRKEH